jgi:hypothetical protein
LQIFRRIKNKAAAKAQPEGVRRRIFFDPLLSFDPTTFEPRSSTGAEALGSAHKKWSAQLSYSSTMTEMDRRYKRSRRIFFRRWSELPGRRDLTQIARRVGRERA